MKIKIISDGTPRGTRVTNAATGEDVEGARAVLFEHRAGKCPYVTIEVMGPEIEVTEIGEEFQRFVPAKLQSTGKI